MITTTSTTNRNTKFKAIHGNQAKTTPLLLHNSEILQDSRIISFQGLKLEAQHTRKTRWTLSWVYKHSDVPYGKWRWLSLWL